MQNDNIVLYARMKQMHCHNKVTGCTAPHTHTHTMHVVVNVHVNELRVVAVLSFAI